MQPDVPSGGTEVSNTQGCEHPVSSAARAADTTTRSGCDAGGQRACPPVLREAVCSGAVVHPATRPADQLDAVRAAGLIHRQGGRADARPKGVPAEPPRRPAQRSLMELGRGFCFVARQKRITIGADHFYIDLVFYHRILKCFVLIDLKMDPFKP